MDVNHWFCASQWHPRGQWLGGTTFVETYLTKRDSRETCISTWDVGQGRKTNLCCQFKPTNQHSRRFMLSVWCKKFLKEIIIYLNLKRSQKKKIKRSQCQAWGDSDVKDVQKWKKCVSWNRSNMIYPGFFWKLTVKLNVKVLVVSDPLRPCGL